jgi:hypothetical protein
MQTYRVDFLDERNNLTSTVELQEAEDAAAIQHALRINIPSIGGRFEVWQGERLVHKHRN